MLAAHPGRLYLRRVKTPAVLADALDDRYQLGAGGMATVYLAHDHKHGREVAIKVLRADSQKRSVASGFFERSSWRCPFLALLRGMAEFDRIVARAAERVAAFKA